MRRTGVTLAFTVSVGLFGMFTAGCAGPASSAPSAAVRPAGTPVSSTAAASARPSVDPDVIAAAMAYKAAADAYNRTVDKLAVGWEHAIISQQQTSKVRAHYKGMAGAEQTFADAIRKVTFPKGMEGHIKALLDATDKTADSTSRRARSRWEARSIRGRSSSPNGPHRGPPTSSGETSRSSASSLTSGGAPDPGDVDRLDAVLEARFDRVVDRPGRGGSGRGACVRFRWTRSGSPALSPSGLVDTGRLHGRIVSSSWTPRGQLGRAGRRTGRS